MAVGRKKGVLGNGVRTFHSKEFTDFSRCVENWLCEEDRERARGR